MVVDEFEEKLLPITDGIILPINLLQN